MTERDEADIRDALRTAAVAVGHIPWQHNRDQAAAAVVAFFRAWAKAPGAPAAEMHELAAEVEAVQDQPDWWPEAEALDAQRMWNCA